MKNRKTLFAIFVLPLLLTGCTGGGGGKEDDPPVPPTPIGPTGPVMDAASWKKALSKDKFSNFKATSTSKIGPIEEEVMGPVIGMTSEYVDTIEVDKTGSKELTIKDYRVMEISDSSFHEYALKNPEMIEGMGGEEAAYLSYVEFVEIVMGGEFERNDLDDGWISVNEATDFYPSYTKNTSDPDFVETYTYNEMDKAFYLATNFADESASNAMVSSLIKIGELFDKATYDETNKCYKMPIIYYAGDIKEPVIGSLEGQYIDLYFNDGELVKTSVTSDLEGAPILSEINFTSYGDAKVELPENYKVCPHDSLYITANDDYHYAECNICHSIVSYEKHNFVDGTCSACGYYPSHYERFYEDGDHYIDIIYNDITGEAVDVNYYLDSYHYDDEYVVYNYTDGGEECTLRIKENYDEKVPNSTCAFKTTMVYSFYKGTQKIHEDVVSESIYYRHKFELVSFDKEPCTPYHPYSSNDVHRASVRCSACGETFENLDCFVEHSDEYSDVLEIHDMFYRVNGYIEVQHEIDPATGKCIYCGKEESEITETVAVPTYNVNFTEMTADAFKAKYGTDTCYKDICDVLDVTGYSGNDKFGLIEESEINFVSYSWIYSSEFDAFSDAGYYVNFSSNDCIEIAIDDYAEDHTVTFYTSETIGKIDIRSDYFYLGFYFDNEGMLLRAEMAYMYNTIEFSQVTFSRKSN